MLRNAYGGENETAISFLTRIQAAAHALVTNDGTVVGPVELVLGNPSCDADSICSAVAFAQLLEQTATERGSTALVVPVLNVIRAEFRLRLQSQSFLSQILEPPRNGEHNWEELFVFTDHELIQTLDTVVCGPLDATAAPPVTLSLVDHSLPSTAPFDRPEWIQRICRVIDHHALPESLLSDGGTVRFRPDKLCHSSDNGRPVSPSRDGSRLQLFPNASEPPAEWLRSAGFAWLPGPTVGSCASLVAVLWRRAAAAATATMDASKKKGLNKLQVPLDTRKLLAACIINDTHGLLATLEGIRWEAVDKTSFEWLNESGLHQSSPPLYPSASAALDRLTTAKPSVATLLALGLHGALAADLKLFTYSTTLCEDPFRVAYSSLPVSLVELFAHFKMSSGNAVSGLLSQLTQFALRGSYHLLILMACFASPPPSDPLVPHICRQFGIFKPGGLSENEECLAGAIEDAAREGLQLVSISVETAATTTTANGNTNAPALYLFTQKALWGSRKAAEPILAAAVKACAEVRKPASPTSL